MWRSNGTKCRGPAVNGHLWDILGESFGETIGPNFGESSEGIATSKKSPGKLRGKRRGKLWGKRRGQLRGKCRGKFRGEVWVKRRGQCSFGASFGASFGESFEASLGSSSNYQSLVAPHSFPKRCPMLSPKPTQAMAHDLSLQHKAGCVSCVARSSAQVPNIAIAAQDLLCVSRTRMLATMCRGAYNRRWTKPQV